MMMNKLSHTRGLLFFALSFCLLCSGSLSAQDDVRFYVENVESTIDEDIALNVRVENFSDIGGVQFSLEWDADDLEFNGLTNLALGASEQSSFNLSQVSEGRLGYLHFDMSLSGYNLEDGDILFTLILDVEGPNNSIFDVNFSSTPVGQVVANTDNNSLPADYDDGTVTVGTPSKVAVLTTEDLRFVASPNPFQDKTTLRITELGTGLATLKAYSTTGKEIFVRTIELTGREQFVSVGADELPTAGVYIFKIETNGGIFSRKVIFRGNGR
ncbi:hypothetical protein CEQ90_16275 [Lewinellaceae bacterium SD302]|nr:hypothetical protein CEQ90_16275 [Lewinellaceae bacterium SD302]